MSDAWRPAPESSLAQVVDAVGFAFEREQNILVSKLDAPQRKLGYTWAYDVLAPAAQMIIDCEPIYFHYGGKDWMIELWKGQYGIETGCEIGVYNAAGDPPVAQAVSDWVRKWWPEAADRADAVKQSFEFFQCAQPSEQLELAFKLHRKGELRNWKGELLNREPLIERGPQSHWWLTGFQWGVFTQSMAQLEMDVDIKFPSTPMRDAFVVGLRKLGYRDVRMADAKSAGFRFAVPKTRQPPTRDPGLAAAQDRNRVFVEQYLALKKEMRLDTDSNDPNLFDDSRCPTAASKVAYQNLVNFFKLIESALVKQAALWSHH